MKRLSILIILLKFSLSSIGQSLDLKVFIKAYNSKSLNDAFEILKNTKGISGRTYLRYHLGDSSIVSYFGNDSVVARKQSNKVTINCNSFTNENEFNNLKTQALKNLKQIEITPGESVGVVRLHSVYGLVKPLKKGDLQVIITKCTVTESHQIYYQFNLLRY